MTVPTALMSAPAAMYAMTAYTINLLRGIKPVVPIAAKSVVSEESRFTRLS